MCDLVIISFYLLFFFFLNTRNFSCHAGIVFSLTPCFIQTRSSDISDPFDNIMIRIIEFGLKNFQIANFESRWGKGNFKIHGNRWASPLFLRIRLKQFNLSRDLRFFHASHSFDFPYNGVFRGLITSSSHVLASPESTTFFHEILNFIF